MQKEKAPNTAATVQGASKIEHIQEQNTTKQAKTQGPLYHGTGWFSWYFERGSVEERLVESRKANR